ncbi:hypothetical protein BofuT4_P074690.1 [Botrytis cinerea T4]|uniref:Uncharacterized protein n=1 Tax=Botryotinia fuckeliana (strain T4) TaxID=999810 RepID=G2XP61_BOTF4|nr:hypothetical protein BofuT4_P074690.1 [Botrytis cinerea T4]
MSRDMHTVGSFIEKLKKYEETKTLESLLEQEEKSKSPALLTVIGIHDIALPPSIQSQYQLWKENPSQFWRPSNSLQAKQSTDIIAVEAYSVIQKLRLRQVYDVILWRFYVSFFYHLALMLGHGQKVLTSNLYNLLYERLIKALTQSKKITDDIGVIKANLQHWIAAGSRYNRICLALDKGALFLIPQISDDMWENPSLLKGAEFDEAMSHLKSEGIMKLSHQLQADAVANQILKSALDPFRWDVVDSRTITAGPSTEARAFPGGPSIDSRTITAGPSTEARAFPGGPSIDSRTITAGPSTEARAPHIKPNSISSLLNPVEAVQEPYFRSRGIDLTLELRNSSKKRKRVDSISTYDPILLPSRDASSRRYLVGLCPVDKNRMESILGKRLVDGIMRSRKRLRDDNRQFTDAIRAIAPFSDITQDFIYRIWICSSIGKNIHTIVGDGDGLRELFNDDLIQGIETSLMKREESRQKKARGTCAFQLSLNNDDDDYVMEIRLSFTVGKFVMKNLYRL